MSSRKMMILILAFTSMALCFGGCASSETDPTDMMSVQQNSSGNNYKYDGPVMRHSIRELAECDIAKMQKLVNKEINMDETDENAFMDQAATTLAQTVFLQPDFEIREVALRDLKARLEPEQYPLVLAKSADQLLEVFRTSQLPSDQAGSLLALTNLVIEVRALKKPELKNVLQKIADANLKVSSQAKKYAVEQMEGLTSPSSEARSALKTL